MQQLACRWRNVSLQPIIFFAMLCCTFCNRGQCSMFHEHIWLFSSFSKVTAYDFSRRFSYFRSLCHHRLNNVSANFPHFQKANALLPFQILSLCHTLLRLRATIIQSWAIEVLGIFKKSSFSFNSYEPQVPSSGHNFAFFLISY